MTPEQIAADTAEIMFISRKGEKRLRLVGVDSLNMGGISESEVAEQIRLAIERALDSCLQCHATDGRAVQLGWCFQCWEELRTKWIYEARQAGWLPPGCDFFIEHGLTQARLALKTAHNLEASVHLHAVIEALEELKKKFSPATPATPQTRP